MRSLLKIGAATAIAVALAGCAGHPVREEAPHHYSTDRHGHRIACYVTDVENEYECVPLYRQHAYNPYYDPFWPAWSVGYYYYGWPHDHGVYRPAPPPPGGHPRHPKRP